MNRRAAPNPVRGLPGRAVIDLQATMRRETGTQIAFALETISKLRNDIEALKKKIAFLQKVDMSALGEESEDGHVTFVVKNGNVIKAHPFILASKSPVFKKMLGADMIERNSSKIQVEDISAPVLRSLINYLYTAEINFTDEVTAAELFKVAHKYDIPELQFVCEGEIFNSVSEDNLSEMLRISHLYDMKRVRAKCVRVLKDNFDRIQEKVLNDLLSH
ncbi:unnamed protein product [Calypogeia fissa]